MSVNYTASGIFTDIKNRGLIPTSQSLFTEAVCVAIMSEDLRSKIVPLIMSIKQEYLVSSYDQTITAGTNSYFIPYQAAGLKTRDVVLVDANGREFDLVRYEPEDLKANPNDGFRDGFYFDNDRVNLLPSDKDFSAYSLRFKIFRRPNYLVKSSAAAQITAIDTATKTVTCSSLPTAFSTSLTYDFIKGKPSFRAHAEAQAVSSISSPDMVFSSSLPSDLAVGDWVAENGFSPIPQIPYDLHPLLAQRTLISFLEGLGHSKSLKEARVTYQELIDNFKRLVNPRADGSPQKINARRGIGAYSRRY